MVFKIVWTPGALQSYLEIMDYLQKQWSEREVKNFAQLVEKRISTLSQQPYLGIKRKKKNEWLRSIVLRKQVLLIYKVRPVKKVIELSLFWNTHQNPQNLKVK